MKKNCFLLLEVLIALTLISISTPFLISNPIYIYKKEIKNLESLEYENIKKNGFYKIKKMLFQNKIPLKQMEAKKKSKAKVHFLDTKTISIGNFLNKKVKIYYRIWTEKEKKNVNFETLKKIGIEIGLNDSFKKRKKHFTHFLFLKIIEKKDFNKKPFSQKLLNETL